MAKSTGVKYYDRLQKWLQTYKAEKEAKTERAKKRAAEKKKTAKKKQAEKRRKEEQKARKNMEKINAALDKWDKKNLVSNDVDQMKNIILNFNDDYFGFVAAGKAGQEIDMQRFHPDMKLNKYIIDEVNDIMDQIKEDNLKINVEYFTNLYKKMNTDDDTSDKRLKNLRQLKDRFDIDSVQDVVDFFDNIERFNTNRLIHDALTSEDYQYLQSFGVEKGLSSQHIDDLIEVNYYLHGKQGLYNIVFDAIQEEAKKYKR